MALALLVATSGGFSALAQSGVGRDASICRDNSAACVALQKSLETAQATPPQAAPPRAAPGPAAPTGNFGGLSDLGGTAKSAPQPGDADMHFGMVAPFNGANKDIGAEMKVGVETAFDVANDAGGVNGRAIRLDAADDGYDPARTVGVAKDLVEKHRLFGFVGNFGSATSAAVLPYVLENKLIFYGAFSGSAALRHDPPDRYVFNYRPSYAEETDAAVRYLVKVRRMRPEQIAVFAQQDAFGDSGYEGVEKAIRALGGKSGPTLRLNYVRNSVDVDDALATLRRHRVAIKAVVMVATYRAAAKFIEKTRDEFPNLIYTNVSAVGSNALSEELMMLGPRFAQGVIVTQIVPAVEGFSSLTLEYKKMLAKYFPSERPDYVSLEGYVEGKIFLEALKRAGPSPDSDRLVDAFENMHDLDIGLGVPVNFSGSDHQAIHKVWGTQLDASGHYQPIELN